MSNTFERKYLVLHNETLENRDVKLSILSSRTLLKSTLKAPDFMAKTFNFGAQHTVKGLGG